MDVHHPGTFPFPPSSFHSRITSVSSASLRGSKFAHRSTTAPGISASEEQRNIMEANKTKQSGFMRRIEKVR